MTALRGTPVVRGGEPQGILEDIVIGRGGVLEGLLVGGEGGERRIPFDDTVRFEPGSRSAA